MVVVIVFGADVNECTRRTKCQCPECKCRNTWGGYDCECGGDLLYISEHDTCISKGFLERLGAVRGKRMRGWGWM